MSLKNIIQCYLVLLWLLFLSVAVEASSNLASANQAEAKLIGVSPDRFVAAAPLIVGATCSDGIVLIAVHTMFADEPLLLDADNEKETSDEGDNGTNTTQQKCHDLPREYRGPFRIYSVDSFGTSLACAGWRADGQTLAKYCRYVAREEAAIFGVPRQTSDYGNYLASEASAWMARSALSERLRPLSCAGLLACCGESNTPGCLWLVDITGAYRIQAHAVGSGALAGKVNEQLAALELSEMKKDEVCKRLVTILSDLEEIPQGSRLEIATVGLANTGSRAMKRRLLFSIRG